MRLICRVYLEVEMIPVGIARLTNFADSIPFMHGSLIDEDLREMGVV